MFDNRKRTKVKNTKIQCWRWNQIRYRPGKENSVPDTLTCAFCSAVSAFTLDEIHRGLCHPGVARLLHFVR